MLVLCSVTIFSVVSAAGQDIDGSAADIFGLGDQLFSISAGGVIPLFIMGVDPVNGSLVEPALPHLGIGAAGSLRWGGYLTNEISLGVELAGMFSFSVLKRTLVAVPITGLLSYTFRFFPFEVPLFVGLGVNFLKLDTDLYFGPVLKPGAAIYWNYSSEWAFGLRVEYWWIPEIYFGRTIPADQTSFGNFAAFTLSTLYHF